MSDSIGDNAKQQLLSIIERIENRAAAKQEIADEITDIYAEAKGVGYDLPALKAVVRMRKEDASKREHRETLVETYKTALGIA
jgi:uncharacterized protein (UPF0335 family)